MNSRPRQMSVAAALAVALVLIAMVFWNSTGLTRVFDDWSYHAMARDFLDRGGWRELAGTSIMLHWSPLSWLIETANAALVGAEDDRLIRALNAAFLFAGLLTLSWVARWFRLGWPATLVAMAVLALHHANALAFFSYDIYTQVGADTLVWLSLSCALWAVPADDRHARRLIAASLACFVFALLMKEQAFAVLPGVALIAAWATWWMPQPPAARRLWRLAAAVSTTLVGFVFLQSAAGAEFSDAGPYSLCVSCGFSNTATLVSALLDPFRTIDAFLAFRTVGLTSLPVILAGLAATAVVAAIWLGIRRAQAEETRARGLLVAALLLSSAPVVLLASVRPFHAHAMIFWFALLIGSAVEGWTQAPASSRVRVSVAAIVLAYVTVLHDGQRHDLEEMRATSDRARAWLVEINRALDPLPPDANVVIRGFGEMRGPDDYSLIRLTTPAMLLDEGTGVIVSRRGRGPAIFFADEWTEQSAVGATLQGRPMTKPYAMWVGPSGVIVVPPEAK